MNAELRAAELNRKAETGYSYAARETLGGDWVVLGWDPKGNEFYREEGK